MKVAALILSLLGAALCLFTGLVAGCTAGLGSAVGAKGSEGLGLMSIAILLAFVIGLVGGGQSLSNPKSGAILLVIATVLTFIGGAGFAGIAFAIAALLDFIALKTAKKPATS